MQTLRWRVDRLWPEAVGAAEPRRGTAFEYRSWTPQFLQFVLLQRSTTMVTYTAPFSNFCLNRRHSIRVGDGSTSTRYDALLSVEAHVIEALHTRKSSIAPTSILANLGRIGKQFSANRQQDAHEFLRSLTENMRLADLNLDRSRPSTSKGLMHNIFGGLLYSQIQCAACPYCTSSTDAFLDLSMEVNQTSSVEEAL